MKIASLFTRFAEALCNTVLMAFAEIYLVKYEEDVDGMPMDGSDEKPKGGFVPSKWETIDKTELEAQGNY